MKISFKILFVFLFTFSAAAQNNTSKKDSASKSTISLYNLSGDNFFYPDKYSFGISPRESFPNFALPGINDSSTIWMRTRMEIMNNEFRQDGRPVSVSDMLHPYLNFYIESKNISLLRRVLGMAQLGTVGYLAYKHIKKYGLFHNP